jgi:hypothetical protein
VNAIIHTIATARTESVIYFLLTAYVEARMHGRRLRAPDLFAHLPLRSAAQVDDCLHLLHTHRDTRAASGSDARVTMEALRVLTAARERLKTLQTEPERLFSRPLPASPAMRQRVYGEPHAASSRHPQDANASRLRIRNDRPGVYKE